MSVYSLSVACERSIVAYLQTAVSASVTASYYTGANNEDKEAPAVIVSARVGQETYWNTNVYAISVTVTCKEMAYDTDKETIGVLAANVFNCFYDPQRNVNFSNTGSGFATFQVQPQDIETATEGGALINRLTCDFIGCLSGTNFPA